MIKTIQKKQVLNPIIPVFILQKKHSFMEGNWREIVEKILRDHHSTIRRAIDKYGASLRRDYDQEDLYGEFVVELSIYIRSRGLQNEKNINGLVSRIVQTTMADLREKRNTQKRRNPLPAEGLNEAVENIADHEQLSHLDSIIKKERTLASINRLDQLSDSERKVILEHIFEHKQFTEIGSGMGISTNAAYRRYQRAVQKLRRGGMKQRRMSRRK